MPRKKRILFISRSYPPITGGIENQNKAIYKHLSEHYSITKIVNTRGKIFLPFFIPWAIFKSLLVLRSIDTVLLGDGVLSIIGWIIKKFTSNKIVICVIHGLDITYPNKLYQQLWVNRFFQYIDHFIAVSSNTKKTLMTHSIEQSKITIIPNGAEINQALQSSEALNCFKNLTGITSTDKKIILSLGRLVKRKGVAWFLENVMPKLDDSIVYLIAGDGPETNNVEKTIAKEHLSHRVFLLGKVSEKEKQSLYLHSHLFVQPNISVKGDIEGFGISVIEAGMHGLPVIASNIDGLKDAIKDNKNGWLIGSENSDEFIEKINDLLLNNKTLKDFSQQFCRYNMENYHWSVIIKQYGKVIEKYN